MPSSSRRSFLAQSSLAFAGLSLGLRSSANALPLHARQLQSLRPVSSFLPDLVDPATLRRFAQAGIDAAQQAGAHYADIRIADSRTLRMVQGMWPTPFSDLQFACGYGLRIRVEGGWAFVFGSNPTVEAIARAARSAVTTARGIAKVAAPWQSMAPAPVVTGEWKTAFEIDPFAISPDEHAHVIGSFGETARRVPDSDTWELSFNWLTETRVFASTEGSLVTQQFTRSQPTVSVVVGRLMKDRTILSVPGFSPKAGGFETVLGSVLHDRIKETGDEAARLMGYPQSPIDVGRYEAVLEGEVVGTILAATLAPALEMGRALGYEADGVGTSCLAPDDVLGKSLFAPQLQVTADRAMPGYGAVKWDDEGVEAESFPVIQDGCVVDYFTTRSSASRLAAWYAKRGLPVKSRGSAVAWSPTTSTIACASQLTIATGQPGATLDEMAKRVSNGLLVRGVQGIDVDPTLTGGICEAMLYEVKRGEITRRLTRGTLQFSTKSFWKSITSLGDASTRRWAVGQEYRDVFVQSTLPVFAPAAHVGRINVMQTGTGA